jgi:hypothetical protein
MTVVILTIDITTGRNFFKPSDVATHRVHVAYGMTFDS